MAVSGCAPAPPRRAKNEHTGLGVSSKILCTGEAGTVTSDFGALLLRKKKAEKNARIPFIINESEKRTPPGEGLSSFEMADFDDFL